MLQYSLKPFKMAFEYSEQPLANRDVKICQMSTKHLTKHTKHFTTCVQKYKA